MDFCSILEPRWDELKIGDSLDFLGECILYDPAGKKHLLKSVIHRRFIVVVGELPKCFAYSILQGSVMDNSKGIRINILESTEILCHQTSTVDDITSIVELCSGIGVMSDGLISGGGRILCKNEMRQPFVDLQTQQGFSNMILGDIGEYKTMRQVFDASKSSTMVVAGFSCQPWSRLGDGKRFGDSRASSILFVLKYAFFSRAHSVLLECVQEAGVDVEVQQVLREFCNITGFKQKSINLTLEKFWPSKRARWWSMLVNPAFPMNEFRPLPEQVQPPTVSSLFPYFPVWPTVEEEQLALDLYETNKFIEFNSIDNAIIKGNFPLATALHGWGNQLQGCPCGCRKHSLDHGRLKAKGLFGALVTLDGFLESVDGPRVRCRHIHPFELSVLTGAIPNKQWMPNLKLSLCGLGQMASPIQSAWMYGQYIYSVGKFFDWTNIETPELTLWHHVEKVLDDFQVMCPMIFEHANVATFISDTHDLLFCRHMDRIVPSNVSGVNQLPSTDMPTIAVDIEIEQPPIIDDGYISIEDQVEKQDEWVCPYKDCFICDSDQVVAPLPEESEPKPAVEGISPTIPFEVEATVNLESDEKQSEQHDKGSHPFNSKGGLVAFSKKRPFSEVDQVQGVHHPKDRKIVGCASVVNETGGFAEFSCTESSPIVAHQAEPKANFPGDSFTQSIMADIWDIERVVDAGFDSNQGPCNTSAHDEKCHYVQLFFPGESRPSFVKVPKDATMGSIQVAEDRLMTIAQPTRPNNVVGVPIPIASVTGPFQQIFLRQVANYQQAKCGESSGPFWDLEDNQVVPRIDILFQQEAWVAKDEMDFYLTFIQKSQIGIAIPSFVEIIDNESMQAWWNQCTTMSCKHPVASAICHKHHWSPIVVSTTDGILQVLTTTEGKELLIGHLLVEEKCISTLTTPQVFKADCGFQSVGVIIQALTDLKGQEIRPTKRSIPVEPKTAVAWRRLFEHHLLVSGLAANLTRVGDVVLGGASNGTPESQLQALLVSHGVPQEHAKERGDNVIGKIGRPRLVSALRSQRPWVEIKAACNEITPKVQLVLPSELEAMIKSRVAKSDMFGDKTKKKPQVEKGMKRVVLAPPDISIPDGIFKQGANEIVRQIPLQSIGQDSSGIVVLTSSEATPYLKLSKPITKNGLAILILDHNHPSCQGLGHVLRFPCRCEHSGEPIIATARLIQLGCTEITRNLPEMQTCVEEVCTSVVRILLYRDECSISWNDVIQRPVKYVLQQLDLGVTSVGNPVVDVWDRQYLDLKMSKTKPALSELFVVSVRLQGESKDLVAKSGSNGIYVEPRSQDGRTPDETFRVIWLSRVNKAEAITAMQSTQGDISLTRSGLRFGLRTSSTNAESIHVQHKGNVPYLDTSNALKYIAGPFLYGVTKDGLVKLFGEWGWKARPIQPRGRSGDGVGIQWEIQAESPPESECYSMKHGDIIISEISKKKVADFVQSDVLASAKTLAMLRGSRSSSSSAVTASDPVEFNDPWASWTPSVKHPRVGSIGEHASVPSVQVDSISANFDRKLAETVAQFDQKLATKDVSMSDSSESRLNQVESRLNQLEASMQQQHSSQQQHQAQVAQKFQQIEQQMESQTQAYQHHLDTKMSEQLAQIEILLGKRARRE